MTGSSRCVVAVVGSLNLDLTVVVARAPEEGETVLGRHLSTYPGGKGANQAVGAARLAPTAIVGAVGSDHAADVLRGVQQKAGVDTSHLRTMPGPTGRAVIVVSDDGQNRIVVVPEANSLLKAEDVTTALDALDPAVVLTQLELLPAVTWAAARWAHDHDRRFVLNPSPAVDLDDHVLAGADPLVLNEQEALHYANLPTGTPFDDVVTHLLGLVRTVVITRGGEDVVVGTEDAIEHLRVPQVDVVDTTGAGDHFAGTLAALLGNGEDLFAAARRASADAARLVASRRADR
ncbi:ribokinase [Rhodococcus gordoniae]|uniref:ribokinase n=1 Tax=Rhodococcus gordoniae TaxID=223392 RepID=UPI0035262245